MRFEAGLLTYMLLKIAKPEDDLLLVLTWLKINLLKIS